MERHPFDAVSFVFGLLCLGAGVLLVTGTEDDLVDLLPDEDSGLEDEGVADQA